LKEKQRKGPNKIIFMYYSTPSVMSTCTAHITKNRNRSKIYENSVYLKDGENFEIELFNPTTSRVLAKITINGNSISNSGIVLKPGERVYLERFIDSNNKFVFETYEVEGSNEALNAIRNNGGVEVYFYTEITTSAYSSFPGSLTINSDSNTVYGSGTLYDTYSYPLGGTTVNNLFTTTSFTNASIGANASRSKSVETGRIEKGDSSNQLFESVNGNFSSFATSSVTVKLLPESQKPVEVSTLRNYCTNCGTRAKKQSWKFCPSCGSKI
jgi:hypothetical protein